MPWDKEKVKKIVEGALFSSNQPMNIERLSGLFFDEERPTKDEFKAALGALQEEYAERGVVLKEVASGYRFQVNENVGEWVSRMWEEKPVRYSRALLETLALVAYRQPITRGEIEEIRGVSVSSHIMKTLLEREWVRVVGHRDVPGRPAMFATTRAFLDYFNLKNLVELPPLSEIRDFDKINEELELEDVVPDAEDAEGSENGSENEAPDESVNLESSPHSDTGSSLDSEQDNSQDDNASSNPGNSELADTVEAIKTIADVAETGAPEEEKEDGSMEVSEHKVVEQKMVEQGIAEENVVAENVVAEKPAANTLAAIVRQFEANKAQEAETDALDKAVVSEAQLEEDLMVAEAVERQLEQDGEVSVGEISDDVKKES